MRVARPALRTAGRKSSHTAASKGGYSGRSASEEDALCAGSRHEGLQGGGGLGHKTGAGHPSSTERETSTNSAKDESVGHTASAEDAEPTCSMSSVW